MPMPRIQSVECAPPAIAGHEQDLLARLRQAQQQLLQSEKMAAIGQIAAGIAHEINNPVGFVGSNLSTLQGYASGLLEVVAAYERLEGTLGDAQALAEIRALKARIDLQYVREDLPELIAQSQEGLTRVKRIVQDLKEFSHVGARDRAPADLHRTIEGTLNVLHNEIKYKATVLKEYGDLPPVECIASQIGQVMMNLLINAAHAIQEQGVITVRTGVDGGQVWLEVEDTGCGIPSEHLPRLFDPFFTTKPVGKGTGLGLSISAGIVREHRGNIEVESEVGKGTRFRVWLPVEQR